MRVVNDVSLDVQEGEILGIVGPNGAGKTTFIECLIGLRQPDSGSVQILDLDPYRQARQLRQRIGVQLQEAALPDQLKVCEALDLFASFYDSTTDYKALINRWGLRDKYDARFKTLSGGQKQRLFIALALVNDPEIVFLDELTTGLDPAARRQTWELVRGIREAGKTVVLVTHYMDEAETLCDRVAIFNAGRLVALDTPQNLIASATGGPQVRFTAPHDFGVNWLGALPEVEQIERDDGTVIVTGCSGLLAAVATALAERGHEPSDLQPVSTTLEDVFIAFTGGDQSRKEAS